MPLNTVLLAFALTLFAGLATGIGSSLAFFTKRTNTKLLSVSLGFSAGVMIYVSLVEIFQEAKNLLSESMGEISGTWITVASTSCRSISCFNFFTTSIAPLEIPQAVVPTCILTDGGRSSCSPYPFNALSSRRFFTFILCVTFEFFDCALCRILIKDLPIDFNYRCDVTAAQAFYRF